MDNERKFNKHWLKIAKKFQLFKNKACPPKVIGSRIIKELQGQVQLYDSMFCKKIYLNSTGEAKDVDCTGP